MPTLTPPSIKPNGERRSKRRQPSRKPRHTRPGGPPWYETEAIMARVLQTGDLDLAGKTTAEIAALLGVSYGTVQEDLRRMNALRLGRPANRETRDANRERSLDLIRRVQRTAWNVLDAATIAAGSARRFDPEKLSGKDASELLGTILAAEKEVIKLQGTTPAIVKDNTYDPGESLAIINDLAARLSQLPRADGPVLLPAHAHARPGRGDPLPLVAVGQGEPASAAR